MHSKFFFRQPINKIPVVVVALFSLIPSCPPTFWVFFQSEWYFCVILTAGALIAERSVREETGWLVGCCLSAALICVNISNDDVDNFYFVSRLVISLDSCWGRWKNPSTVNETLTHTNKLVVVVSVFSFWLLNLCLVSLVFPHQNSIWILFHIVCMLSFSSFNVSLPSIPSQRSATFLVLFISSIVALFLTILVSFFVYFFAKRASFL